MLGCNGGGENGGESPAGVNTPNIFQTDCGTNTTSTSYERTIQTATITGDEICCFNEGIYVLWNWITGSGKPLPRMPLPLPDWSKTYFHPSYSLLSFLYPNDWTPETINFPNQQIGVNLLRNDGKAVYQSLTVTDTSGAIYALDQLLENNVNYMLNLLEENGGITVYCIREAQGITPAPGIIQSARGIALTAGQTTLYSGVQITTQPTLPLSHIVFVTFAAPSIEFTELTYEVLLNLIVLQSQAELVDNDGDGIPDIYDHAPADPRIS